MHLIYLHEGVHKKTPKKTAQELTKFNNFVSDLVNKGASHVESPTTSEGSVNVDMETTSKNSESTGNSLQSSLDAVEKPVEGSVEVDMETSNTHSSSCEAKIPVYDYSLITSLVRIFVQIQTFDISCFK